MPYEESSYAEVLRWLEDTEIQYVPHGKKAGTKSYDRYEKYSQAKTVSQALEFGSKPLDLVHDYEKKLLKRIGGPVREKPLNLAEVSDPSTLTQTDRILGRWGYMVQKDQSDGNGTVDQSAVESLKKRRMEQKEAYRKAQLSVKYGVKADEMAKGTGWAESPAMVAMRSRANMEAASILDASAAEDRKITDDDVLRVLRLWAVKKNGDRKNVFPDGVHWVHSETIGLLHCAGARLLATLHCNQYPKVLMLLSKWMKDNRPEGHTRDFPFTSITVNASFSCKRHRDHVNFGPSAIKAFGKFEGGELKYWAEDNKMTSPELLLDKDAVTYNVSDKVAVIDGNRSHEVTAYVGEERFSLVFFTAHAFEKTAPDVREQLIQVGIPFPDEEATNYLKGLLPGPKGYAEYAVKTVTDSEKVARAGKMGALAALKGLQRRKQNKGILGKMLAMRSSGSALASTGSVGGEGSKKILTPLASRGLLARVLAKRAQGEGATKIPTAGNSLRSASLMRKPKSTSFGGLLARVQKKVQSQADVSTGNQHSAGATEGTATPIIVNSPMKDEEMMSANGVAGDGQGSEASAAFQKLEQNVPERAAGEGSSLAAGDRLQKFGQRFPRASAKRKGKPLSFGGLLARVQKRTQPEFASPSGSSGTSTPPAESTPARKRPRSDAAGNATEGLTFSGKKSTPPEGLLKRCLAQNSVSQSLDKIQVVTATDQVAVTQMDCDTHQFLSFANLCCSTADNASAALAEGLRQLSKSDHVHNARDTLCAAMALLVPSDNVPAQPIAAAIAKAFSTPCDPNVRGEMLAAKALEASHQRETTAVSHPLTVRDIAEAKMFCSKVVEENFGEAVQRIANLLERSQKGMEPFFVVRALQGKLGPDACVMHSAVAQALVPV